MLHYNPRHVSSSIMLIFRMSYCIITAFGVVTLCKELYQLNAKFIYSITIYMLHYNPRHVSSSNMLIFRMSYCIITASGIVTLCKRLYG